MIVKNVHNNKGTGAGRAAANGKKSSPAVYFTAGERWYLQVAASQGMPHKQKVSSVR